MIPNTPAWLASSIFYELYPQSFLDTNGDGIGDLEGVVRKLDYIRSIGCNAIWLNPCFESPFGDAGYDVADFYKVAARYGTNDDLVRLFAEAKTRGIRVCLDLVAGHTSNQHPWFQESCKVEPNKYTNWYIWTRSIWEQGRSIINGYCDRDANYLTNFFWFQPALNYGYANPDPEKPWQLPVDHPDVQAVRAELFKIMRFWLDLGADGFRVDMAASLVKNDGDLKETMALWAEVREMFDRDYPDRALMSEWSEPLKAIKAGFHIDFMLAFGQPPAYTALLRKEAGRDLSPLSEKGRSFFDRAGKGDVREFFDTYLEHYLGTKDRGYITIPSGNHDVPRLAMGRTREEIEAVFAFVMTMPGIPFIYYGDEIGLRHAEGLVSKEGGYTRTGARTPMQWNGDEKAGFSVASASDFYLPLDPTKDRPNVAEQEEDPGSLLNGVRKLAGLRSEHPALQGDGELELLLADAGAYPLVYRRSDEAGAFVVAINPAGYSVTAEFGLGCEVSRLEFLLGCDVDVHLTSEACRMEMPPITYSIHRILE